MARLDGTLVLPGGFARGAIEFENRITRIDVAEPLAEGTEGSRRSSRSGLTPPLIAPGFIDTHVHGGAGGDTMDGADGVARLAAFHATRGTTTILPTTMTNPFDRVLSALRGVADVMREGAAASATLPAVLGAHVEGPFINSARLGAQPDFTLTPSPEAVDALLATGVVRVVTLAPEVEGAVAAGRRLAAAGARVSVGHTVADHESVAAFAEAVRAAGGTVGFTHLFNAMPGLESRAPGVVGAALADGEAFAEVILDLHHVHPVSFLAAAAAKRERLFLITDAIRAAGAGDGSSELGGQEVTVVGGAARLADGTLAGSVLTLDVALKNAVAAGLPVLSALAMTSAVPAGYLGLSDRGRLDVGARADLVVLGADLGVEAVYVEGAPVR